MPSLKTLLMAVFLVPLACAAAPDASVLAASSERVTNADFPTHLRPEPDSLQSLVRIPPSTTLTIEDMRVIRLDKFKENWYRVTYDGKTGWVRGDDLEGEAAEKNFSVTYQAPDLPSPSPGGVQF